MAGVETSEAIVLDASVAVRSVVSEQGSDEAVALLSRPMGWIAPRLMLVESAAALRRKIAADSLTRRDARDALNALLRAVERGAIRLFDDETIVAEALGIAIEHGHKLPDCVYLAIAERENAALATADRRRAELARRRSVPVIAVPSA